MYLSYIQIGITFLIGLFVFVKNPQNRINKVLFGFIVSLCLWLLGVSLLNSPYGANIILGRAIFIPAVSMAFFMFLFANELAVNKISKKITYSLALISILALVLSVTPFVINNVKPLITDGNVVGAIPVRGLAYPVVITVILSLVVGSLGKLTMAYKRSVGYKKQQIFIILVGFFLASIVGTVTNVVLPNITGSSLYTNFSLLSAVILSSILSYAIIKHRFLDIRLVVARSVAYTLLLGTLGAVYGIAIFGISNLFFSSESFSTSRTIIDTLLALVLIITFQPLKKFFDRITNKLFYRDAYSSEELLDELNSILVSSIELEELLRNSAILISSKLKADYTLFSINKTDDVPATVVSDDNIEINVSIMNHVKDLIDGSTQKVIITDYLEENNELKGVLRQYDIALMARLDAEPDKPETSIGYMVFGPKRSGNIYNSQDTKVVEIMASELVIAIQNAILYEKIKAFNRTLQKRVEEATHKLRETNEKLRKLDEAKDEFITMASHQLRTPLTTIKGYLSMMLEGDAGKISDKQKDMIKSAFTSSNRMVYLIADLLNVSRLSTGKFVIDAKRVNLVDVIRSEVNQLERHFEAKNLELDLNIPEKIPSLELDENKTRQVIMNFIDNAIYYTPDGGKITITLEEKDKSIEFTVKDTGIGVPKEEQHKLFSKFFRAKNAKKARPDGTGLGLYLCQKVVTAQGGSIIFDSEEGKGSTFGFTFPKDRTLLSPDEKSKEPEKEKAATT